MKNKTQSLFASLDDEAISDENKNTATSGKSATKTVVVVFDPT